MPGTTDNVDLQFTARLNADPAVKAAKSSGEEIAKALSVSPSIKGVKRLQSELKDTQTTATKAYDALIAKTNEWAKAKGVKSVNKKVEYAKSLPEFNTWIEAEQKVSNKVAGITKAEEKHLNSVKKTTEAVHDEANAQTSASKGAEKGADEAKAQADAQQKAAKSTEDTASGTAQSAKAAEKLVSAFKNVKTTAQDAGKAANNIATDSGVAQQSKKAEELTSAYKKVRRQIQETAKSQPTKITLGINADVAQMTIAQLVRHLGELKARMKEIEKAGVPKEQEEEYNAIYEAAIHTNSAISKYRANLINLDKESGAVTSATQALAKGFDVFSETLVKVSQASGFLNKLKAAIDTIGPAAQSAGLISEAALTEATAGLNLVITVIAQAVNAIQNIGNALQAIWAKAKQVFTAIYDAIKKVIKSIGDLISKIRAGLKKALDSVGDSADKAFSVKNLRRTLQMLTKYIFGVRSFFFLYRKLRAGVTEGLKNLVQFESASNETNHAITELRSSLLYLKNAWAAAFAPIINFVYPVLVKLMDMLASVGNAIARFIAAFTGASTVLQAVKVDAGDYADSLKSAGGSAKKAADEQKKLNDRLAAFDDLNVLGRDKDDEDTSPSGGGGGSPDDLLDPNSMFERVSVKMDSLMQKIREAWQTGDAFDLGDIFATNLEASLDKAHKWLEGEGRDKILKIANLIGTFIDGVLSHKDLGEKIGQVIGEAFDLVCDTINTIITPARMLEFGKQVAGAMNTAIPLIVPAIGETLGNLFRSAISGIYGWVTTADWKGWGQAIADGFNNMLAQLSAVNIKGTKQSPHGLNGWDMLGISITDFAQGMIDMLGTAISQADWQSLGEGLGRLLSRIDFTGIWSGLTNIWTGMQDGAKGIWSGFTETAPQSVVTALQPIATVLQNIPDLISEITWAIKKILPSFDEVMEWLQNLPDTIDRIVSVIEQLLPIVVAIAEKIGATIETVVDWSKKPLVGDIVRGAGAGAAIGGAVGGTPGAIIGGAVGSNVGAYLGFGGGVYQLIDAVDRAIGKNAELDTSIKGVAENIKGLGAVADNIKGDLVFDNVTNNLHAMTDATKGYLGEIPVKFTEIKGAADAQSLGIKDRFVGTFDALKSGSVESATAIQDNFTLASDNIKDSFINTWAEIKKSISEGGELFVALSDGMGNTVKSLLNAMITGINTSITKPLQDISKSFNVLRTLDVNGSRPFAGIPYLNVPAIPHLAQGAVIPPNKQFMAVLGDQTSGTNIEAPLDTIRQAVGEEFAPYFEQMIQATMQVVQAVNNKNLVIGDREIGKANARYLNQQKEIRGTML